MKPEAVITEDKELVRLLKHLRLPTAFPVFKPVPKAVACHSPPDEDNQLDPRVDLYDNIDPPSPED